MGMLPERPALEPDVRSRSTLQRGRTRSTGIGDGSALPRKLSIISTRVSETRGTCGSSPAAGAVMVERWRIGFRSESGARPVGKGLDRRFRSLESPLTGPAPSGHFAPTVRASSILPWSRGDAKAGYQARAWAADPGHDGASPSPGCCSRSTGRSSRRCRWRPRDRRIGSPGQAPPFRWSSPDKQPPRPVLPSGWDHLACRGRSSRPVREEALLEEGR